MDYYEKILQTPQIFIPEDGQMVWKYGDWETLALSCTALWAELLDSSALPQCREGKSFHQANGNINRMYQYNKHNLSHLHNWHDQIKLGHLQTPDENFTFVQRGG